MNRHDMAVLRLENGVYLFDHPYSPGYQIECLCDECRAITIGRSNPTYWFDAGQNQHLEYPGGFYVPSKKVKRRVKRKQS